MANGNSKPCHVQAATANVHLGVARLLLDDLYDNLPVAFADEVRCIQVAVIDAQINVLSIVLETAST